MTSLASAFAGEIKASTASERLHPKYKLPAGSFAYVGDRTDTKTWKLPYLFADGRPDLKRLPGAIQAITTSYRGKNVSGIPDERIPDVLIRLGKAAVQAGKMPFQDKKASATYRQLEVTLGKLGRLDEIKIEKIK
jgi:hypothetical protein